MLKHFDFLERNDIKLDTGGIISFFERLSPIDDTNYFIPISSIITPKQKDG